MWNSTSQTASPRPTCHPSLMNMRPPPTLASAAVPSTPCIFISISNYPSLDLVTARILFFLHYIRSLSDVMIQPFPSSLLICPLFPHSTSPPPPPPSLRGTWGVDSSLRTVSLKGRQWFKRIFYGSIRSFFKCKICTTKTKFWKLPNENCEVWGYKLWSTKA